MEKDAALVSRTLRGDREAFAELYDRWARLIRAIGLDVTRDIDEASDLTQEIFLRAYRKLGNLRDPDRFSAWLVGIARQVGREWRRERARAGNTLTGRGEDAQDPPDERIPLLREAMASLPERERLALHAFYLRGLDLEQAREVLGLSRSGMYRVLSCARERLRRVLSKQEITS